MKTILLKFAGPLQSWGSSSHFETRHTDYYPSKSAIIGLIAASLGYRRDEDDKIKQLNEVDFAVRVDQQGNLLRDYHTAKKYKDNGEFKRTYVTNRYYLEDAIFIVAISHQDDKLMNAIEEGLNNPYFQTFMGRRSCPLSADFFLGTCSENVLDSIKTLEWQASKWFMKTESQSSEITLEIFADSYLINNENDQLRKDRVESFSQKERKFGFRYESRLLVTVSNPFGQKNTQHDIFTYIGD